ncbi:MAG: Rrf2 family transcriptional regulator [Chromatiales bacterium]
MRLTRFSDYAMRVLIYLAMQPGELATISEIATAYGISKNHLMKVVNLLTREGYIEAVRGGHGGIRLHRPPESVNIGEVVRRTEDDLSLAECFGPDNQCVITPTCRLKIILSQALEAFLAVLEEHTLADMVSDKAGTRTLLGISHSRRAG